MTASSPGSGSRARVEVRRLGPPDVAVARRVFTTMSAFTFGDDEG